MTVRRAFSYALLVDGFAGLGATVRADGLAGLSQITLSIETRIRDWDDDRRAISQDLRYACLLDWLKFWASNHEQVADIVAYLPNESLALQAKLKQLPTLLKLTVAEEIEWRELTEIAPGTTVRDGLELQIHARKFLMRTMSRLYVEEIKSLNSRRGVENRCRAFELQVERDGRMIERAHELLLLYADLKSDLERGPGL